MATNAANVAKALQMIADKWNETRAAGLIINDGDEIHPENWFFALWAYNTGFYPEGDPGDPWGVGWTNNPANMDYPVWRGSFLDGSPSDAAAPQNWPYPEKVLGYGAHSYDLVERVTTIPNIPEYDYTYVTAFQPAWWSGATTGIAEQNRTNIKPPLDLFCEMTVNDCDWNHPESCTRSDWKCWWHEPATWKDCNANACGHEFVRFEPALDYMSEQANGDSFPPNCGTSGLPPGSLVVDDSALDVGGSVTNYSPALAQFPTTSPPVKTACNPVTSSGKFELDFGAADANGNYPSKIDFHQLSGGLNAHFYFAHTWSSANSPASAITGTWTLNQPLNQWARVMVHIPDHAAWAQGAAYVIDTGSESQTRTLLQHRYSNQWVPLGVFQFDGVPSVSLSNVEPQLAVVTDVSAEGLSNIAWDAVAFQPLSAKPSDFVVALGDSFSSGEGVGTANGSRYFIETNNDGNEDTANACHRSTGSWSRKAQLPGTGASLGQRADSLDANLDFHFLACSGAEVVNLLPIGQQDGGGRFAAPQGLVPTQLDQGYLDENTTLVTFSIGGNDIGFADVVTECVLYTTCNSLEDDVLDKIEDVLPNSLRTLLEQIHSRAPNAAIYVAGYPALFEEAGYCIDVRDEDLEWLNGASAALNTQLAATVAEFAGDLGVEAAFGDPRTAFSGYNLCQSPTAINGFVLTLTAGESNFLPWPSSLGISQESVHPNYFGTDLYADVMEDTLAGIYP